nr:DUF2397 family protein [Actinoplanes toevensis]
MAYLIAPGSDDYIRIMAVLESSVTDLTPSEIAVLVSAGGPAMSDLVVQKRLDKLKDWTAATGRSDPSRIRRHADILARNWRWTATPAGRQVHRFYTSVLAATPTMREIPLPSLARIVESVEQLALAPALPRRDDPQIAELIGRLFTGHDDLDTALVGAEDSLAGLADRFDLDQEATDELKGLLATTPRTSPASWSVARSRPTMCCIGCCGRTSRRWPRSRWLSHRPALSSSAARSPLPRAARSATGWV